MLIFNSKLYLNCVVPIKSYTEAFDALLAIEGNMAQ